VVKSLLSLKDLSKDEIIDLIKFSNNFIDDEGNFRKEDLFPDKTVANVFCEPSTRTKSSFAIAARNLGCSVIDFNIDNSSVQKGESIFETVDALNLMGVDLCVLRHPDSVIQELANTLPKMVFINAGEGSISHPTQALLDMKTIIDHKNSLDGLKIVIVGDLDHSRVTSSFIEGISNFSIDSLTFSGHPEMCTKYQNPQTGNYERFDEELNLDLEKYKKAYQLTSEKLEHAKGDAIIMHPGPVNYVEITEAVYDSENSVIRQQIANGVAIRMAVLSRFLSG
jgi:aspartate carbamoyltransferase catalytic subunit